MSLAIVVMAAGQGSRMKSSTPKVLHTVGKKAILGHILEACAPLKATKTVVVYNHDVVKNFVTENYPHITLVKQTEQLGTGHAVRMAEQELGDFDGDIMMVNGDTPLVYDFLPRFAESHLFQENDITVSTGFVDNPTGLGRIVRDTSDDFLAIVEHKDASPEQRCINEIATGFYVAKSALLFKLLRNLSNDNAQSEYYITDIVSLGRSAGHTVGTFTYEDPEILQGVNTRLHLAICEDLFQNQKREEVMAAGVTLTDPQSVFFSADTKIAHDVTIGPNVQFGTEVAIETGVIIEGNAVINNATLGSGTTILSFTHIDGAIINDNCKIGPHARIRPDSQIKSGVKIGNFVEIKKATLGENTAAGHLSYIGNATIGESCNIGAGTITANYDGANKFKTTIGDRVYTGAQTVTVAPVSLANDATTAAGSIITKDVPQETLVISKVTRVDHPHYKRPKKK